MSPAAERVRLEGERTRLEQEIAAWRRNEARAAARLRLVEERLAALSGAAHAPAPAPDPTLAAELDDSFGWPGFTLEY